TTPVSKSRAAGRRHAEAPPLPTCIAYLIAILGGAVSLMTETARRFCAQHASVESAQTGFSFPKEMVVSLEALTPATVRYCLTASARRAPNARLYSRVPRSSQFP